MSNAAPSTSSSGRRSRLPAWEWLLVTLILLGAFALRVARFSDVPPGVIHDEVRNWLNAQLILSGDIRPLYPYGGGREALYLILQALSFRLLGDNLLAARLPSIAFSLIGLAATYSLSRRLFGRLAGIIALTGLATSFWSLMFARLAVRTGSMPALALVVAYLYLRLMQGQNPPRWQYGAAGVALGATLYTYPSALIFPFILLAWIGAVALFRRDRLRGKWLPLALGFATAALIAIPLVRAWADPATAARADEVNAPLEALLAGDPGPTLANVGPVLGMFSVRGDHGLEFNIQDQPIFPSLPMAILFYAGLLVALGGLLRARDERRPGYALALLWLGGMLVPTLVTERPVNPSRTIGLLAIVYVFPAIAAAAMIPAARRQGRRALSRIALVAIALSLMLQLDHTLRGYFTIWPQNPVVRFLYQDDYRRLAADLDRRAGRAPVAVGGLTPEQMDPASMRLLMADDAEAEALGFFDPQTALLLPAPRSGESELWIIVPDFVTPHPALGALLGSPPLDAQAGRGESYTRYTLRADVDPVPDTSGPLAAFYAPDGAEHPLAYLLDVQMMGDTITSGESVTLLSVWRVTRSSETPLRIFVHLTDAEGAILSQNDVLGVPAVQWREGDRIIQAHDLSLPADGSSGPYSLVIGLYNPDTGVRLTPGDPPDGDSVRLSFPLP